MESSSQNVTTNKPTANFLQARCPSCHSTNSVKASMGIMPFCTIGKFLVQQNAPEHFAQVYEHIYLSWLHFTAVLLKNGS